MQDPKLQITNQNFRLDLNILDDNEFDRQLEKLAQILVFEARWNDSELHTSKLNEIVPHVRHSSLICKADDCPFARKCSVLNSIKPEFRLAMNGTDCREERIFGVKTFVEWVNNLSVSPDETPELLNVAQLVHDLILQRRIRMELAMYAHHGTLSEEFSSTKTGVIFTSKFAMHPLIDAEDKITKRIETLQKRLIASRKDKLDSISKSKVTTGFMEMMAQKIANNSLEESNIQEAEYIVEEDDD